MTTILPTKFDAIVAALEIATDPGIAGPVWFCHGGGKCELSEDEKENGCHWCHVIREDDPRDAWQVQNDMEKQTNGH